MESLKDSTLSIVKDELEQKEEPFTNDDLKREIYTSAQEQQYINKVLREFNNKIEALRSFEKKKANKQTVSHVMNASEEKKAELWEELLKSSCKNYGVNFDEVKNKTIDTLEREIEEFKEEIKTGAYAFPEEVYSDRPKLKTWGAIFDCLSRANHLYCYSFPEITGSNKKIPYVFDWDKGIYTDDIFFLDSLTRAIIGNIDTNNLMKVWEHFTHIQPDDIHLNDNGEYIIFNNGILKPSTGEFLERFDPEIKLLKRNEHNYNPTALLPTFHDDRGEWTPLDMITDICEGDEECINFIFLGIRVGLGGRTGDTLLFWLYDNARGGTGKSTFSVDFMGRLLGGEKLTGMKVATLQNLLDKFGTSGISEVNYIYGDDNSTEIGITGTQVIKSIGTGEVILTEQKLQPAKMERFTGLMVQTANGLPYTKHDKSEGWYRRITFINVDHLTHRPKRPKIKEWLKDERVHEWAIAEAFRRYPIITRHPQDIPKPKKWEKDKQQIKEEQNPALQFFNEVVKNIAIKNNVFSTSFMSELYRLYDYPDVYKNGGLIKAIKPYMKDLGYTQIKRNLRIENNLMIIDDHANYERYNLNNEIRRGNNRSLDSFFIKE